ncbi:MAG: hypothetical protein M1817_006265 [Caeruleum heppii]|nr:MAG: hypothetical protein M1817_006265 [Caeruleum heppii]
MSFAVQTPQRPLPGAYFQTPAPARYQPGARSQPSFARQTSSSSLAPASTPNASLRPTSSGDASQPAAADTLKPIERAARAINDTLAQEARFPDLDSYVGQGISSDYDIPSTTAWAPFQRSKIFDIPDKVFEQYNQAQVSTMMGLFAEFNHAWITIDNAFYLWDYTQPNPELVGFEDQPYTITAVKLVLPRPGVFVPAITHLLVVATTAELILVGLSFQPAAGGNKSVSLYATHMSLSIKGMDVTTIEASPSSGRIFFSGHADNDIYELTYQQEEKWFQGRCAKINHTSTRFAALAPSFGLAPRSQEYIVQMVVDDSRSLFYTLSSSSTIRAFQMTPPNGLEFAVMQRLSDTFSNITHMTSPTDLLPPNMTLVSISTIPAREASKLHLMATTSTGCRLFLSATPSYRYMSGGSSGKLSMQVQHVRFPPPRPGAQSTQQRSPAQARDVGPYQGPSVDTRSMALVNTRKARRFPPGYFLCFVPRDSQGRNHTLFISSPDSGRIARPPDSPQAMNRYQEHSLWMDIEGHAEDIGLVSPPFGAASTPVGFGNELAVQFDSPASELAILTNTGIHTIRRRRLVDIFAAAIRYSGGPEGLEGETRRFVRLYGRGETAATALAVACGQGLDVTADSRVARVTDPEVLGLARKAFIEFGGKPTLNENFVVDQTRPAIDNVRPSPRHEGVALYVSRLVRSVWKAPIIQETVSPTGGLVVRPVVGLQKIQMVQRDLAKLQEFLNENKSFIEGLAGPESLMRVGSKQEEVALQAEHRALHSLVLLISDIIEGISFVLVLFDERVDEIILSLPDNTRQQIRRLTYEGLFATNEGKDVAKELVKAIVNRNIANGSNVDTIADALRRRCGSFCSADDVKIFKAQEQLKKASEAGADSEMGRRLLNESLGLFQQVAGSLSMEHLQGAVEQYTGMQFYAGAIQLVLSVAKERDRGNSASSWLHDGKPPGDPREAAYTIRVRMYEFIHFVVSNVDQISRGQPETIDGVLTLTAKRKHEAYNVIDNSDDEVFQYNLYDWFLAQGWVDRLLAISSDYVVSYLQTKAADSPSHADLLWRYHAQREQYFDAATVQLQLAKSEFRLGLDKRIEYLSQAKANASTFAPGISRQPKQLLLHEISELLEVGNIQGDILTRLRSDERLDSGRREEVAGRLDGQILGLTELFNTYADQASYFDICLLIFQAADHRNPADIRAMWQSLLDQIHQETADKGEPLPFEAVAEKVRSMGNRLNLSESTFPVAVLLPMLLSYAHTSQRGVGPAHWVMDIFFDLSIPPSTLLPILEGMFYNDEAPFAGKNRRIIATDILYIAQKWYQDAITRSATMSRGKFGGGGGEVDAESVAALLGVLMKNGMEEGQVESCRALRAQIERAIRGER